MEGLIRVNGLRINPEMVAALERREYPNRHGIFVRFAAGGKVWVPEPTAQLVETAYEEWFRDRPHAY